MNSMFDDVVSVRDEMETQINENKGTVTVIIKECSTDALDTIIKRFNDDMVVEKAIMPNTFVGVARCSEEDTFDAKIGGRIASKRAMDAHKKAYTNAIKGWIKAMLRAVRDVSPAIYDDIMVETAQKMQKNGLI